MKIEISFRNMIGKIEAEEVVYKSIRSGFLEAFKEKVDDGGTYDICKFSLDDIGFIDIREEDDK